MNRWKSKKKRTVEEPPNHTHTFTLSLSQTHSYKENVALFVATLLYGKYIKLSEILLKIQKLCSTSPPNVYIRLIRQKSKANIFVHQGCIQSQCKDAARSTFFLYLCWLKTRVMSLGFAECCVGRCNIGFCSDPKPFRNERRAQRFLFNFWD